MLGAVAAVGGASLALIQRDVKRMFAYGGVSHIGLIMLGAGLGNQTGLAGALFYLINDAVMQATLFVLAGIAVTHYGIRTVDQLGTLRSRAPWLAGALIVVALSMVGIPPTGGFFGKWYIVLGAIEAGEYVAVAAVIVATLLTLAYFGSLLVQVFGGEPARGEAPRARCRLPPASAWAPCVPRSSHWACSAIALSASCSTSHDPCSSSHMSFVILIPLLPLLACLLLAVAGRRLGEASHKVGSAAVAASFALSLAAFAQVLREGPQTIDLYRFLHTGALSVDFGFHVDELSVLVLLLVTGVSTIVHVYSSRYMIGDPRYARFFAVMALFTSAMATLVMSRNLLMTYMCWEAMGICSYLLISHWAHRKAAGAAAIKAFLVNAVADVGPRARRDCSRSRPSVRSTSRRSSSVPAASRGSTVNLLSWVGLEWPVPTTTLIPLLLFTGAMGKSAQLPFHVWLPFAMEAPTPVSALIHAATMVNAGPFLLLRFSPLLLLAPTAMAVIAVVGAATALFASVVSMTQSDIKKTLAYSTIGQIGFMIMACGVGAFAAALFHLLAHGFLKAFLFLSTGSVLQALTPRSAHDPHAQPGQTWTPSWALSLGALLLACVPPAILFSGSYEGLWTLHGVPAASFVFWALALVTVFLTAAYLFRAVAALFQEELAASGTLVRPRLFSVPHIGIVAAGALVLIGFFYEFPRWFTAFVAPALPQAATVLEPVARSRFAGLATHAVRGGDWRVGPCPLPSSQARAGRLPAARSRASMFSSGTSCTSTRSTTCSWLPRTCASHMVSPRRRARNRGPDRESDGERLDSHVALALACARGTGTRHRGEQHRGRVDGDSRWLWRVLEGRVIHGTVERLSHQTEAVGRFLHRREMHTLQEHLLLVVGRACGASGALLSSSSTGVRHDRPADRASRQLADRGPIAHHRWPGRWCGTRSGYAGSPSPATLLTLGLALFLWSRFDTLPRRPQFVERANWMPTFNIHYAVGVDGISVLLVVLTALLSPLVHPLFLEVDRLPRQGVHEPRAAR